MNVFCSFPVRTTCLPHPPTQQTYSCQPEPFFFCLFLCLPLHPPLSLAHLCFIFTVGSFRYLDSLFHGLFLSSNAHGSSYSNHEAIPCIHCCSSPCNYCQCSGRR